MPHREPHKTIYLQWIGVDRDELTESDLSEGAAEVTWCQDKINDTDLEYRLVERKKCDCEGIGCEQCRPREAHAPATPATPTPEDYARLREYVVRMAGIHDDDCPADDTCDCSGKAINDSVNLICKVAEAAPTTPDKQQRIADAKARTRVGVKPRCSCGHKARSHGSNWEGESPEKEATGFPVCHYPGCPCVNYNSGAGQGRKP